MSDFPKKKHYEGDGSTGLLPIGVTREWVGVKYPSLKTLPHVTISSTISLTMPVVSIVDDGIQR